MSDKPTKRELREAWDHSLSAFYRAVNDAMNADRAVQAAKDISVAAENAYRAAPDDGSEDQP